MVEPLLQEKQLVKTEAASVEVSTEPAGTLALLRSYLEKSLTWGQQMTEVIEESQKYWADFWQAYQRPIVLLAWIVAAIISFKIVFAVMDAVDDVPFLEPTLAFVGLSYTVWFTYRYLVAFVSRQQLLSKFKDLREQVFGQE